LHGSIVLGGINMDCSGCDAFCCYDGVSLTFDEIMKIKVFVNSNKEYFSFLPEEYIVGNRTKTRKQEYNDSFPDDLPKTRCIFGYENGDCSLQSRSIELGLHPWEIKPKSCWLFPLRAETDVLIYPFTKSSREYDGFFIGFPCGKKKTKKEWKEIMQDEINYFKEYRK